MDTGTVELREIHWLMDVIQSIDVGLIVLDRDYRVLVWNGFMQAHSGLRPTQVAHQSLFELFPEVPEAWFRRKAEPAFQLGTRIFSTWEQRPWLLPFKSNRPITGVAPHMYQNLTFLPLQSVDGAVHHLAVILYDVTDSAVGKTALQAANRELERLSRTDRLTGINNRGAWDEAMAAELRRYRRTRQPATLVMFDIDHFKKVNDRYGHPAGDDVIRATAATLVRCIRVTDIPGRYGGEEFAVVLIDTGADEALLVAERLRQTVEAQPVRHGDQEIGYTISLGLAELTLDLAKPADWVSRADQALYRSKQGGRNRVTLWPG